MRTITYTGFAHRVISALRAAVPSHSAEEQKKSGCASSPPSSARSTRRRLSWERLRLAGSKNNSNRDLSSSQSKTSESNTVSPSASLEPGHVLTGKENANSSSQLRICRTLPTVDTAPLEASSIYDAEATDTEAHQKAVRPPTPPTRAPIAIKHNSSPQGEITAAAAGSDNMARPRAIRRGVRFSSQPDIVISYEADDTFARPGPKRAVTKPKNVHATFIRAAPESHSDLSSAFDLLDNYVATRPNSI